LGKDMRLLEKEVGRIKAAKSGVIRMLLSAVTWDRSYTDVIATRRVR
jgi:hypothetical protein